MILSFFRWPLGPPLGVSWDPFGGLLGSLGASWGYLWELLGAPLGILGGFLSGKAPKMPSRTTKTSQRPPQDLPKTTLEGPPCISLGVSLAGTYDCTDCWDKWLQNWLLRQIAAQVAGTNGCKIDCRLGQMTAQIAGTHGCRIGCWDKSLHRLLGQMAANLLQIAKTNC